MISSERPSFAEADCAEAENRVPPPDQSGGRLFEIMLWMIQNWLRIFRII
jgi:hypothetical protein